MIGFDFNGVVDLNRPGLRPTIDDCIITGNTFVSDVLNWLSREGIQCAVYFPPDKRYGNKRYAVGVWKSEMIRRLKLIQFFEDDPIQAQIIEESCPDCDVVRVT